MKTNETATPKKATKRGKNYGHHSGLHGEARIARTQQNKDRRAAARERWLAKRQSKQAATP